mmetsp:Transcript_24904/g.36486  ORF Transcript_24904/g.36486 Transcript_24904/m.36486 type:complete len:195 (-) Transcript_24904:193-777(-)
MAGRMLRLVVFDLDFTIWQPEMYQLWGKPRLTPIKHLNLSKQTLKEAQTTDANKILTDNSKTPITVFGGAAHALMEINRLREEGHDIQAAVASRTDEPDFANTCMQHLKLDDGTTLAECFGDRIVIDCYNDKTHHLEQLRKQTDIPYDDMCFFDNEHWNIQCVQGINVHSIYTPDGMTKKAWRDALKHFEMTDW